MLFRNLLKKMSMCYSTSTQSTTKTNIPWFKINKLYEKISLSSEDDVKHFLATNFLFENEHFISYNKPAGVHAFCGIERNLEDRTSSVEDIIHLIAHKHDCPDLQICNAPHPDYSGVMLLAKSSAANNAMRKSFKLAKKAEKYLRTDLAITIGVPDPPTDLIKVSIENRKIKEKIVEMPVLNPSITKIKTKAVRLRRSYYEVLDSMKGMSLVKIQPRDGLGQQSLIHISCKMCQVLGDRYLSNRIVNINGIKMFLDHDQDDDGPQKLSPKLKRQLLLTDDQLQIMPLHIHRWRLSLPSINELNLMNPVDITAPLPEYFSLMLHLLNLKLPDGE